MAALVWLVPGLASAADWLRAESPHFVVYSSGGEAELRTYVRNLEDFDDLLRRVHNQPLDVAPTRKLDIYLVSGPGQLADIRPGLRDTTRGFYVANLGDIFATSIRTPSDGEDDIVMHEYVHHFMRQNYGAAYPAWLTEGYAEYFMTAKLEPKVREVGRYNQMRANTLLLRPWIRSRDLLSKRPDALARTDVGAFYAQAWLLTHYVMSDPTRRRGMAVYLGALGRGTPSMQAWTAAFGDDEITLDRKLKAYLRASLPGIDYPRAGPLVTDMTVTTMPASADHLLLMGLRARTGTFPADRDGLLEKVRTEAARYPGDRLAQLTQAQAEVSFGDLSTGLALLDKMLGANPDDIDALRLAAYAHVRRVRATADDKVAEPDRVAGLALLGRAYKLRPDDYQVLFNYAAIQVGSPGYPSENAINALLRSIELAPQVDPARMLAGEALIARDRGPEAVDVLTSVANNPHGGAMAEQAQVLIAKARGEPVAAPSGQVTGGQGGAER
jgi:tetratricopeptide (TPR) repeat protein